MRPTHTLAALALLAAAAGWSPCRADGIPGVAEFSLTNPTLGPGCTSVTFDVGLFFAGFDGFGVRRFGIDVSASSPALAGGPVPYSAFGFTLDPALQPDWTQTSGFGNPTAPSYLEYQTTTAPLSFGDNHLGVLSVDLAALGLLSDTSLTVSIAAAKTTAEGQFDDDPSTAGTFFVRFNPGSQALPEAVCTTPVPAPPSALLLAAGGVLLAGRRAWGRVRRG